MSKRNLILLIIILIISGTIFLGYFYFNKNTNIEGDDQNTNFISRLNPFTNKKTPSAKEKEPVDVSPYQPDEVEETVNLKFRKVSSMPIAGFTVYSKERLKESAQDTNGETADDTQGTPSTTKTKKAIPASLTESMQSLRYISKKDGNVYQTFVDKIEERKFSTTIIPKIYDAYFANKGTSVVIRYLKDDGRTIQTFLGNLPKEFLGADTASENEMTGSFLPENIKDISLSADALSMFYLFEIQNNQEDRIVGTTLNFSDNKKVQIFDSIFTEWLSYWPNNKTITLTTKPASGVLGYMYNIDKTNNKNFTRTLGGINGLTTLTSPNGKLVLYGNDNLSLSIYNIDTKTSDLLRIKTLPEKCVWGKISDSIYCSVPKSIQYGKYPDDWYQGSISFGDQFWKIDIKTGNATLILDPITMERGEEIDGIKLTLDENEDYLFFVNKKDSFLWKFDLK